MASSLFSQDQLLNYEFVITYYEGTGYAEISRLLCAYGGLHLKNEFIDDDTIVKYKPELLFGQVPRLQIKKDGKVVFELVQSKAIARYLAGLVGLQGRNLEENAMIDCIVDGTSDARALTSAWWSGDRRAGIAEVVKKDSKLEFFLTKFDSIVKQNGGFSVNGNRLTWADVMLFNLIEEIEEMNKWYAKEAQIETSSLATDVSRFPHLQALKNKVVHANNHIEKYLQSETRPKSFFAMPEIV